MSVLHNDGVTVDLFQANDDMQSFFDGAVNVVSLNDLKKRKRRPLTTVERVQEQIDNINVKIAKHQAKKALLESRLTLAVKEQLMTKMSHTIGK